MTTISSPQSYKESVSELIGQLKGMFPEDKFAVFNHDANQLAKNHTSPLKINAGDQAPTFSLPNANGDVVKMAELLAQGPVVLVFYRGVWCPYCNLQLKLLQGILPEIKQAGANLVAISPMNPDNTKGMLDTNKLSFEVLSDASNKIARQFTHVFKNADEPIQAMADLGYDFYSFYDDKSAELPVSATFIISTEGVVVFAESEGGDYRARTEPKAILDALNAM